MKQELRHTPGPWQTMNSPKAGFRDIWSLGDDQPQNRKVVCEISPSDTTFGDAELIAAAPDLLEACRSLLTSVQGMLPGYGDSKFASELSVQTVQGYRQQAEAAIAKAEGK